MSKPDFEELIVYQLAEKLANEIWNIVREWDYFEKDTVVKHIVRASDSVCENFADVRISRGSLYETFCFLRLAYMRELLTKEQAAKLKPITDELSPKLNAYLKSIGNRK